MRSPTPASPPEQARDAAQAAMNERHPDSKLVFDHLTQGEDNLTREAWDASFTASAGFGSAYSGCDVFVRKNSVEMTSGCAGNG